MADVDNDEETIRIEQVHSDEESIAIEEVHSDEETATTATEAHNKLSMKNPPIIHHDQKATWNIGNLRPQTTAIIIGDSGIRALESMPANVETHVFLNANLDHAACILEKMKKQDQLKNILIQVGLNNRTWVHKNSAMRVNRILQGGRKLEVELGFIGAPVLKDMSEGGKQSIVQTNSYMKEKTENYIEPLTEVCMRFKGIYDNNTLKAFSDKIFNSNFLDKATNQLLET